MGAARMPGKIIDHRFVTFETLEWVALMIPHSDSPRVVATDPELTVWAPSESCHRRGMAFELVKRAVRAVE